MNNYFLYIDEATDKEANFASLTGILLNIDIYVKFRTEVGKIIWDIQHKYEKSASVIRMPVELHANDLLRGSEYNDEDRLRIFTNVVEICNKYAEKIFHIGIINKKQVQNYINGDDNLYGPLFFYLQDMLSDILSAGNSIHIVFDGIPSINGAVQGKGGKISRTAVTVFLRSVRTIHHLKNHETIRNGMSIEGLENLGEPMFADSANNMGIMAADIISYILLKKYKSTIESYKSTEFSASIATVFEEINQGLLISKIIQIELL